MALVTVQRSSTSSACTVSTVDFNFSSNKSGGVTTKQGSLTENYFVVKGAALILRKNECHMSRSISETVNDLQQHLQSMFGLLCPNDSIILAVRLESKLPKHARYLVVVTRLGRMDTEETGLLGFDIDETRTSIGLVMPVFTDLSIKLDGDGGFKLSSNESHHIIKPVTVQALWSAFQSLNKATTQARMYNYYPGGITHTWLQVYCSQAFQSEQHYLNEWNQMDDLVSFRSSSPLFIEAPAEEECLLLKIKARLKEIMVTVDLDEVTSKYLRERLEEDLNMSLSKYGKYIDDVILQVFAHMDASSEILEYLYLGSEWNASNYEELKKNNVGYILNVSREIDNFFPGEFSYLNIRVFDNEDAELMREWEKTYRFISEAKEKNLSCLVHCKMGISRSAATVIAFLMKENELSLEEAYEFVQKRRNCARPNAGFMEQLKIYEGILQASRVKRRLFPDEVNAEETKAPVKFTLDFDAANTSESGSDYLLRRFMNSLPDGQNELTHLASKKHVSGTPNMSSTIPRITKPDSFWIRNKHSNETDVHNRVNRHGIIKSSSTLSCFETIPRFLNSSIDDCSEETLRFDSLASEISALSHNHRYSFQSMAYTDVLQSEIPSATERSGTVRKRVRDLEKKKQKATDMQVNRLSTCSNTSSLNKIQQLVRLYSVGMSEGSKFISGVSFRRGFRVPV